MVVGEPQILGQIKSAYEFAVESKTSGLILHRLLHRAFHVAKRVRTETKIGDRAISVSSVAVEVAETEPFWFPKLGEMVDSLRSSMDDHMKLLAVVTEESKARTEQLLATKDKPKSLLHKRFHY
jgi:glutamyl-tRNA reductase